VPSSVFPEDPREPPGVIGGVGSTVELRRSCCNGYISGRPRLGKTKSVQNAVSPKVQNHSTGVDCLNPLPPSECVAGVKLDRRGQYNLSASPSTFGRSSHQYGSYLVLPAGDRLPIAMRRPRHSSHIILTEANTAGFARTLQAKTWTARPPNCRWSRFDIGTSEIIG
jgi:hypothetical protein